MHPPNFCLLAPDPAAATVATLRRVACGTASCRCCVIAEVGLRSFLLYLRVAELRNLMLHHVLHQPRRVSSSPLRRLNLASALFLGGGGVNRGRKDMKTVEEEEGGRRKGEKAEAS